MDIQSATAAASARPNTAAENAKEDQGTISSDFETFLTLLTAQMENQDPLNPIDSTDYATQLATFSGVEQQVLTNDLLEGLSGQMSVSGMSDLAGWVGMEARVAAPAYFDGVNPISVAPNPPFGADQVELVAYNAFGSEVSRQSLGTGTDAVTWQPRTSSGNPLPVGSYDLKLESSANGAVFESVPADIYARVTEIRTTGGQAALVLKGGALVQTEAVSAIREPAT